MSEPIPREYEIFYRDKERKEDVISDIMGLPFQKAKQFGKINNDEWENKLILGDNLQVTKYLLKLKKEGKLQNSDGTDGFRLIYIDPPFATKQEFRSKDGALAYNDKIFGSKFIELLRKRLILLNELLSDNGSIYVHLDYRKAHYIKIILDEIFEENNFVNEIVWKRRSGIVTQSRQYGASTDTILFYAKTKNYIFNSPFSEEGTEKYIEERFNKIDENGRRYRLSPIVSLSASPSLFYEYKGYQPPKHGWSCTIEVMKKWDKAGKLVFPKEKTQRIQRKQYLDEWKGRPVQSLWDDIYPINPMSKERIGFPTQKPEKLLERIIKTSSNKGDLILDSFCGSGTTLGVAEKLERRWIGVDSSKFAIYTTTKKMLTLKKDMGNVGKPLKTKPFGMYNAGLYIDGPYMKNLDDVEYEVFALELFQVEPMKFELNGFQMEGMLMNSPVHIFPRTGALTEEYIENLDKEVGNFVKSRLFIIAPANRVYFLQDYIEIKGKRYYVLRIPYSIIDELHKKKFVRPWQPTSAEDMNQVIDAVGFDFIHPPEVEAEYSRFSPKNKSAELEIKIKKFESVQRTKNPIEFKNKESLSMVMIDRFYDGNHFDMTDFFFADKIKDSKWKISFPYDKLSKKLMIIYLDVLGNERIEVKNIFDFKVRKK